MKTPNRDRITSLLTRWKKTMPEINSKYSDADLRSFLPDNYIKETMINRKIIATFLKESPKIDLKTFDFNQALKVHSKRRSVIAKKSALVYDSRVTKLEKCQRYKKSAASSKLTRVQNYGSVTESYRQGILTKGSKRALEIGINPTHLTDEVLFKFSGSQKRNTHAERSEKEKAIAAIKWKRSNLKNRNVSNLICTEYPDFFLVDAATLSDEDVIKWYMQYVSIRSTNFIINNTKRYNYKQGYFKSSKTEGSIFYRSSLEKETLELLDSFGEILGLDTEPYHIKYYKEDGCHRYVPDVLVTFQSLKKLLIEIKPFNLVEEFEETKGQYVRKELELPLMIVTDKLLKNKAKFYEHLASYC